MTEGVLVFLFIAYILFLWALGGGIFWALYYLRELSLHISEYGTKKGFHRSFLMSSAQCGMFKSVDVGMFCLFWPFVVLAEAVALTIGMPFYWLFLLGGKAITRKATIAYLQKTYDVDKAQAKKLASSKDIDTLKALNGDPEDLFEARANQISLSHDILTFPLTQRSK